MAWTCIYGCACIQEWVRVNRSTTERASETRRSEAAPPAAGMEAAKIGEITGTRKLEITNNSEKVVVWDFAQDTIMGIGAVACR